MSRTRTLRIEGVPVEHISGGQGGHMTLRTDQPDTLALRDNLSAFLQESPSTKTLSTPLPTRNRRHRVERIGIGKTTVVRKTYSLNPGHNRFRKFETWFALTFLRDPARKAFQGALLLKAAGMPTAEPLAYGQYPRRSWLQERFLICRPIDAEGSMRERLEPGCALQHQADVLLDRMADQVRELNNRGVRHGDLATGNWLIGRDATLWLIDTDKVRRVRRRPAWLKRALDLRCVARMNLPEVLCHRFALRYLGSDFSNAWWQVCRFWRPRSLRRRERHPHSPTRAGPGGTGCQEAGACSAVRNASRYTRV